MKTEMKITIQEVDSYDGPEYRWKVISDGDAGFYLSGKAMSYRYACRQAWKAAKRLKGIGFLPFEKKNA